ncbi:MAG TPA: VWA domain-containing protein [Pyrinomonadaceae bacterium]|nr:VWA domain-containing protein [Pyrinomonadaceae bacterium]
MIHRTAVLLLLFALSPPYSLPANGQGQVAPPVKPSNQPQSAIDQALSQEEPPIDTLRVTTTLVNVPVQVMDRDGRFVPNLQQADFRLYEDGVRQEIAFFNPVEAPFTVVLLIDTSPSTRPYRQEIRSAAVSFIDQLRPEDRVMVVAFNGDLQVVSKVTKDREQLRKALQHLSWNGIGTLLYGTVELLLTRFFNRIRGRKALVVLTDGEDADARTKPTFLKSLSAKGATVTLVGFPPCNLLPCVTAEQGLYDAEEADTIIYPIQFVKPFVEDCQNVGEEADNLIKKPEVWSCVGKRYLNGLADRTGGRFFHADDPKQFAPVFNSIAEELRYQYNLGYYPANNSMPGGPARDKSRCQSREHCRASAKKLCLCTGSFPLGRVSAGRKFDRSAGRVFRNLMD